MSNSHISDKNRILSRKCIETGHDLASIVFDEWTADEFGYLQEIWKGASDKRMEQMEVIESIKVVQEE